MVRQAAAHGMKMVPVEPGQVQLGGEMGRRIRVTIEANLLALDVDTVFLQPFRQRDRTEGYIGLGKLIDATVRLAAYSGDPRVVALKQRLVSAAIGLQEADGYVGMLVPASRIWGVYDIHETAHIVLGLANDHRYFGEPSSLAAARRLADYVLDGWSAQAQRIPGPSGRRGQMYGVTTGLDAALLTLYEQTAEARYLDFMLTSPHYQLPRWNVAPKIGYEHMDDERHCYIFMALCVAQLQLHGLQPDPRLLAQAHLAVQFLRDRQGHLVSGSCSQNEGWHSDQCGAGHVSESCATAYLLRLLDRLFRWEGDPLYGDLAERAMYNALFAAQSPDGRQLRYFTPTEGPRTYFDRDTFCCPNNFRRIVSEMPGMVYFRTGRGVAVNHYTASTVNLTVGDEELPLTLRQETDYPGSGQVLLRVHPSRPAVFPLHLRLPRWCPQPRITVNDAPVALPAQRGALLAVEREWRAGDRVQIEFPMAWRWVRGRALQQGRAALLRGPVLYCLNPSRNPVVAGLNLRELTIDPGSVGEAITDEAVRPGGRACRVLAWSPGSCTPGTPPDLELLLTEFADPGGEASHLRLPAAQGHVAVDDELIATV
jgi:DUF1680 family protein